MLKEPSQLYVVVPCAAGREERPETFSRMERSDNPLRSKAAKPRKTNGKFRADQAKNEKPVAVAVSIWNTLSPRKQKN